MEGSGANDGGRAPVVGGKHSISKKHSCPPVRKICKLEDGHGDHVKFDEIYVRQWWGKGSKSSGGGSDPAYCGEYIKYVAEQIIQQEVRRVVDLGGGDGRVLDGIAARLAESGLEKGVRLVSWTYELAIAYTNRAPASPCTGAVLPLPLP